MASESTLELSADESLVLFEWLYRYLEVESHTFADEAEEIVLCRVLGMLESRLTEPFAPDYRALVTAARARIRAPGE